MANADFVSLKDAAYIVPNFDGNNIPLYEFLEFFDEVNDMVEETAKPNLVKSIECKLRGEIR